MPIRSGFENAKKENWKNRNLSISINRKSSSTCVKYFVNLSTKVRFLAVDHTVMTTTGATNLDVAMICIGLTYQKYWDDVRENLAQV